MDYLQEGIGLRAMAQRDPLVEYQREGYDLFTAMMDAIKEESVGYLFHLEVQVEDPAAQDVQEPGTGTVPSGTTASAGPPLAGDGAAARAGRTQPLDASAAESVLAALASGAATGAAPVPSPVLRAKGLDVNRQTRLEYSAPSIDGEGGVQHRSTEAGDGTSAPVDPNASRAERRRQARAQRKGG